MMADMVCSRCGQYGIRWVGWQLNNFTHTECPHCGGINCQKVPDDLDEIKERLSKLERKN